ncbi:MAG: hypothetical protein AAF958_03065 [Planctomycetota bacterium]
MKAAQLRPPPSAVKSRMLFEQTSQSAKVSTHLLASVTIVDFTTLPPIPGVTQIAIDLVGDRVCLLLRPLERSVVKSSGRIVALDHESDLQANKAHRRIVPVGRADRNKLNLVCRLAMWIEAHLARQSAIVGKQNARGQTDKRWGLHEPLSTWQAIQIGDFD